MLLIQNDKSNAIIFYKILCNSLKRNQQMIRYLFKQKNTSSLQVEKYVFTLLHVFIYCQYVFYYYVFYQRLSLIFINTRAWNQVSGHMFLQNILKKKNFFGNMTYTGQISLPDCAKFPTCRVKCIYFMPRQLMCHEV